MCKKLFLLTSFVLVLGLVVNASGQPTGSIMREVWLDIGGGTSVDDLTGNAAYPDNPTFADLVTLLEAPSDFADNFGSRIHGWLYPATSGDYTFWIAADDFCQLWLSSDDDPANAVQICGHNSWTGSRVFDSFPEQESAPVALEAGGKYYIMALYKEGGGGDNMSVAWQGPDSPEQSVIDGAFLSPAPWALSAQKAKDPDPADGAVDADVVTLGWGSGALAVSHVVYLDGELLAETDQNFAAADLAPGTAYTWQVDEIQEDGTVIEGSVWSFTTLPLEAHFPNPADAAENVGSPVTLSWTVGKNTIINDVYFGADEALVAARDASTFKGKLITPSYAAGELELFSTYYWAVDEFTPGGTVAGPVWSFSTEKYISLLDGSQTLSYDNTVEPYVSELALDAVGDLTAEGIVSDLTLSFQGMGSNLSIDEATGTYEITGEGADIWGGTDAFHYVYMQLTGDGEISARVVSNGTGSNAWAKGGVMIRESTDPTSAQMLMGMTGGEGGGIAFQGRSETGSGTSTSFHGDVIAEPPYWVKLTREGNAIAAYASADGETWDLLTDASPDGAHTNPMEVAFPETVLIGLFVTSHQDGENRTYTFDNVSIEGDVSADLISEGIDSVSGNSAESVYVTLEDMLGASAMVVHPNPAATRIASARQWTIPLSEFAGVDPTFAAKLYVGVGNGQPGGAGVLTVSDVRVVEPDMTGAIASWEAAAQAAGPGFIATNVPDALYDIGTYGGEQTYEFVVKSNPDETEASMALIGRRQFGDTQAGLKYEQWNNTGTYGATLFGVVDLDFGVANDPGVDTHLVFVSSEATATTALYVNGAYEASVDSAISLSGLVGIGYGAQGEDGSGAFDDFDGVIYGAAIYDGALSDEEIAAHSDAFFKLDITKPGDIVKGVPDEERDGSIAGWPSNEHPALAIDDNVNTKFLHFKGEVEPTGIKVTPLDGPSVVTGLALTTANDDYGRDPIAFELYGSNESIDGPYELIASGDVVDFAQADVWPRFTKNATPITFDNVKAYAHYQVLFTAVRDVTAANSMQIAEVELLGIPVADADPSIILVSGNHDYDADGVVDDFALHDLLTAAGYVVDYQPGNWTELDDAKMAALNAVGLVIISRCSNSGDYNSDEEPTQWNSITTPMINSSTHLLRSSRWKWVDSTSILTIAPEMMELADGTLIDAMDEAEGMSSFIDAAPGNGTVLATGDGLPWIMEWEAGVEYYDGAGQTAGGPRVFFVAGTQETEGVCNWGEWNLTPEGEEIYLGIVDRLLNP